MTTPIRTLCLIIALCKACYCLADNGPSCPRVVQVAQKPAAIPDGFHAYVDGNPPTTDLSAAEKVELDRVAFSDGPPTEMGWLAPDREERTYQSFQVNGSKDQPTWLTCGYSNTSIIISAPLPPEIKSCKVTHDPSVQGYPATGMTCR